MHLVCGEALYDVFIVEDGGADSEVALRAVAGGSPLNVAIGMARLGARVGLATDLAKDPLGKRLAAQLAKEGVADRFLRREAPATALAMIATDKAGAPSYSFSGLERAAYCPTEAALAQGDIAGVHVGSVAIVLPNSAEPLRNLVRRFADRALLTLDPNVRLSIEPDAVIWRDAIEAIRHWCQLIKVSQEDIAALYGDADAEALCRAWLNERTAMVILTKSADGACIFTKAGARIEIAPTKSIVVDSVGAGDSFMAALLSMFTRRGWVSSEAIASLNEDQLLALGSYAALAAGVTCSRRGPSLPTTAELEALRPSGSAKHPY